MQKSGKTLTVIVKERRPYKEGLTRRVLRTRTFKILLCVLAAFCLLSGSIVIYYYNGYASIIDLKLGREVFPHTAKIYGASLKLVTNLSDASRSKRRLLEFKD